MSVDIKDMLRVVVESDLKKDNLAMIDLHRCRELLMDAGALLLDVRPPAKVDGENAQEAGIVSALYMPYTTFYDSFDLLPKEKDTTIIVGCLKGWFANRVMGYLEMLGYLNVYVLQDSIKELIEVHYAHTGR